MTWVRVPGADVAVHRAVPEPLSQTRLQGGAHHHHRGLQTPGAQGDGDSDGKWGGTTGKNGGNESRYLGNI